LLLLTLTFAQDTLRNAALGKHFKIGTATDVGYLNDNQYKTVLAQQYNLVTAENSCKWGATEPARGQFNFAQCDAVANLARTNNQSFRGHNLCWGAGNPSWLTNGGFSAAVKRQILGNHITNVVKHYGNTPVAWDVVNEAIADGGNTVLKNNVWYPDIPDYVDFAFQTARAANPSVKLFYNDYNIGSSTGWSAQKSQRMYDMVKSMKSRGIPIDGVGLQLHIDLSYNLVDGVAQNMQRLAELGLEIHVTELDIACAPNKGNCQWDTQKAQQQANLYAQLLDVCKNQPKCTNFETWGFTDKYTWIGSNEHPLPFDENYKPKPAVASLLQAIKS